MAIKTIPLRDVDEYTENIYEAVCVMSGQARRVLNDRIVERALREAETEEYGVFDEIEEQRKRAIMFKRHQSCLTRYLVIPFLELR